MHKVQRKVSISAACLWFGLAVGQAEPEPAADVNPRPYWVVDPANPGPSLPPVGRSLFDFLVTRQAGEGAVYEVPFPFQNLLARIEQELEPDAYLGMPIKRVLIPLGRSLQRNAAKPDFFRYPRAVAAVDSEPVLRPGRAGMLLKDRLYLGYLEKANVLEVISYNEAAGRFEFQIVHDYRAGGKPEVVYANRAVCFACHQNGAPIFARPLWDETNANHEVASHLKTPAGGFYGFPLDPGVDISYAIDIATDRANTLSLAQLLWIQGCGEQPESAVSCRAGLLTRSLQFLLSGQRHFDDRSTEYRDQLLPYLKKAWQRRWPSGLYLPDPDVPNRNPMQSSGQNRGQSISGFESKTGGTTTRALVSKESNIPAEFEPLRPRPPAEHWEWTQPNPVSRAVTTLSGLISRIDVDRLNRHLLQETERSGASPRQSYLAQCDYALAHQDDRPTRLKFRCSDTDSATAPGNKLQLSGRVYYQPGGRMSGRFEQARLTGDSVGNLQLTGEASGRGLQLSLTAEHNGPAGRLSDGRRIEAISLSWPAASLPEIDANGDRTSRFQGTARLTVIDDFAKIRSAIARMQKESLTGESDALTDKPFRRAVIFRDLFDLLGMEPLTWCCVDDKRLPAATLDRQTEASNPTSADQLTPFYRICSSCHHTTQPFPPNFLSGGATQAKARIEHCAERIFFRLSMWTLPPKSRPKTPMPPHYALDTLDILRSSWPQHPELAQLRRTVATILASQTGEPPRLEKLISRGYVNLRNCLPSMATADAPINQAP